VLFCKFWRRYQPDAYGQNANAKGRCMRVDLIDPSLFTLPYDAALAAGLKAEGHEVVLHGRVPGPDDNVLNGVTLRASFYRVAGAPALARLPPALRLGFKGLDHAWSMAALARRLRRERPDVIHFQWLPLPFVDRYFLKRLRRIAPLVLTVHDTNPFNGNPTGKLQRIGAQAAFRDFDRLIVHTEQGRARLLAHGEGADRVTVMPHGLLGHMPATDAADPMLGELTFLLFGKIKPYKGADLLIEAFARMDAGLRAQARLRIVGKPYMDLEPLQRLIQKFGMADRISLEPRFVKDDEVSGMFVPGVIAAFPYREIEASGVLSLAIGFGRPVLAARLGGFIEAVQDGEHGLLVPAEDVAALAAAMSRFVNERDFAATCARKVRELTVSVPTWLEIARQTAVLYRSLHQ